MNGKSLPRLPRPYDNIGEPEMPYFPVTNDPDIPEVLNPLRPGDYWRLFKWIYFQPSKLKLYLYRADPELYQGEGRAIFRTWRQPAYRNLYVMSPTLSLLVAVLLSAAVSGIQGTPLNWTGLVVSVAAGVALGVVLGIWSGLLVGAATGVMVGVAWSVAFGTALGMMGGMRIGVVGGIVSGAASGAAGNVVGSIVLNIVLDVALGMGVVVVAGVAFGVMFGMQFGVAVSEVFGVAFGMTFGVLYGVAFGAGGSRLLFYPVEAVLAWWLARGRSDPLVRLRHHPAVWDEFMVWPLPGLAGILRAGLAASPVEGMGALVQVAANPFKRGTVQIALHQFLISQPYPLAFLYNLAHEPTLERYLVLPNRRSQLRNWQPARVVLLGEIGQRFADSTGGESAIGERLVWWLTRRQRQMVPTPLAAFSSLLYDLIKGESYWQKLPVQEIDLVDDQADYEGVRSYPHGMEVADSFAVIASYLEMENLATIASASEQLAWIKRLEEPLLRPAVIEALKALGDVGQEVAVFGEATSAGQQSAALNRAAGALNELAGYVQEQVLPPERVLLARIVESWQGIIAAEQGRLGQAALVTMTPVERRAAGIPERTSAVWQRPAAPFDNPYVAGDPVYPPLLAGRQDIFNRIGEVWSAKAVPDSIILYGHRRVGKSSILRNLERVAPAGSVVVYVDMAGETSFVGSSGDLLLGLADKIYAATKRAVPEANLPEPEPADFATQAGAAVHFNRLAERVRDLLNGRSLILALDEFEAIEKAVEEGKIGREIYQFLRTKTQEPWLTLVFGGLHTLDEMSRDYAQPFYGSYENIRVSYLRHESAWRLITNPSEGVALNYEKAAVERIIRETGGQPYLVQLLCRDALDHLNHELFDLHKEREAKILVPDVEAVLGEGLFRHGTRYFDGVWEQAKQAEQRALLKVMAQREAGWTAAELVEGTGYTAEKVNELLRWGERHDIVRQTRDGEVVRWGFWVPLMRRWIGETAG